MIEGSTIDGLFEVVYSADASSISSSGGGLDLGIQRDVISLTEEYGSENLMVILGTPDGDYSYVYAESLITGDPTFAGPLAGVSLNLDVYHVFELKNEEWVDSTIYEEQIGLMELVLDVEDIISEMESVRELKT